MNKIKVERNVPLPQKMFSGIILPWDELTDNTCSFFVEYPKTKKLDKQVFHTALLNKGRKYASENGIVWSLKSEKKEKGIRIWRIK